MVDLVKIAELAVVEAVQVQEVLVDLVGHPKMPVQAIDQARLATMGVPPDHGELQMLKVEVFKTMALQLLGTSPLPCQTSPLRQTSSLAHLVSAWVSLELFLV